MDTLTLGVYHLTPEILKGQSIYGFKISNEFEDFLSAIYSGETEGKFEGRTVLKVVSTLYQDKILHMYGNLQTIRSNENIWFYTRNPFDLTELIQVIANYSDEKFPLQLEYLPDEHSIEDWGSFELIPLENLLNYELFKNGYAVLEKHFLSYLTNMSFEFLNEESISFTTVLDEGGNYVMSQPFFPVDYTPYSYAIKAKIQRHPYLEYPTLEFKTNLKLWVQANPLTDLNSYFSTNYTSVFMPSSRETGRTETFIYNKTKVRLNKNDRSKIEYDPTDQFYFNVFGTDLKTILDQELRKGDSLDSKSLITVAKDARTVLQTLCSGETPEGTTNYGISPKENDWFLNLIQNKIGTILSQEQMKLIPIEDVVNIPAAKEKGVDKEEFLMQQNLLHLMTKANYETIAKNAAGERTKKGHLIQRPKINISSQGYIHPTKDTIKLGLFTDKKIIAHVENTIGVFLEGIKQGENHYKTRHGEEVILAPEKDNLSKFYTRKEQEKKEEELAKRIHDFVLEQQIDGALISIDKPPFNSKEKRNTGDELLDTKRVIKRIFASHNIPTQFIHPKGMSLESRVKASMKDLISKTGFIEQRYLAFQEAYPLDFIVISKVQLEAGAVPCLLRMEGTKVWIKTYPNTEWLPFDKLYESYSSYFDKPLKEKHEKLETIERRKTDIHEWCKEHFKSLETPRRTFVFWDRRIETLLPFFRFDAIEEWKTTYFSLNFTSNVLIRWTPATYAPTYHQSNPKSENLFVKSRNIFKSELIPNHYYLIGTRSTQHRDSLKTLKLEEASENYTSIGLIQLDFYSEPLREQYDVEALLVQELRYHIVTYDKSASLPYPIYLLNHLNELVDAYNKA